MPKVLITGADGFVGKYMSKHLSENGYEVITTDIQGNVDAILDITNRPQIVQVLEEYQVDAIVNLAGFSSVKESWTDPQSAFSLNVNGTLNILSTVRKVDPSIRILIVGSSQEYGHVNTIEFVNEDFAMNPANPYAMSKYAQEQMTVMLAREWGLDTVMTRSFNHYGFGQPKGFVISDFASSIAAIENGSGHCMNVENIDVYRDLTDVRDIVNAYRLLLEKGKTNSIYNVGSGRVYHIREILERMISLSTAPDIKIQTAKIRKNETNYIGCDNDKLLTETGWTPRYALYDSLKEILDFWRHL